MNFFRRDSVLSHLNIYYYYFIRQSMLFKSNQIPPVLPTNSGSQNTGVVPQPVPPVMPSHFPSIGQDVDLRNADPRLNRNMDMDMRSMSSGASAGPMDGSFMRQQPQSQLNIQRPTAPFPTDPRQRADPRIKAQAMHNAPPSMSAAQMLASRFPSEIPNDDQEKTALIIQVLQLTDDQIAVLPPDQRTSIMILKEQIAKSTQR